MDNIETYSPVSVIIDLYHVIYKDSIPAGTELGKAIASGGRAPYLFEAVNDFGNPSTLYEMQDDRIVTIKELTAEDLEPIIVKAYESPEIAQVSVMALDAPEELKAENTEEEEEEEEGEEEDLKVRIPYSFSYGISPLLETTPSIQSAFTKENMIYKITTDINLGGGTLTIPKGSTLDFQGGKFINGVLSGCINIRDCNYKILDNITFAQGSYIPYMKPEYFGAVGDSETPSGEIISTMFDTTLAAMKNYVYNEYTLKDAGGVKFIFQGRYGLERSIVINTPTISLTIDGLNLIALDTFDSENWLYMFNCEESVVQLKMLNCDINANYKVTNAVQFNCELANRLLFKNLNIYKFNQGGLSVSGNSEDSSSEFIEFVNCNIWQLEDYVNDYPESIASNPYGLSSNGTSQIIIKGCNISYVKKRLLKLSSATSIISDCTFSWGEHEDISKPLVTLGSYAIFTNNTVYNCIVFAKHSCVVKNNNITWSNGDGNGMLRFYAIINTSYRRSTLIINNVFNCISDPSLIAGKAVTSTNLLASSTAAIYSDISLFNNVYDNVNAPDPSESPLLLDSILKLVNSEEGGS